jgi:hypothetical protein
VNAENRLLKVIPFLCLGAAAGILTAAIDVAAPWGDDTAKVTLLLLIIFGGLLGFTQPVKPWRWALLVGLWLPITHLVMPSLGIPDKINPATYTTALILIPVALAACLLGAYGGAFLRMGWSQRP